MKRTFAMFLACFAFFLFSQCGNDSDNDGEPDVTDLCPLDENKTQPGLCGCGFSDQDTDADNTPDCQDHCPNDKNKTQPGICGCGQTEDSCSNMQPIITASAENAENGEGKEMAFDGDINTKWLAFFDSAWIQVEFGGGTSKVVSGYRITSANDFPERDPTVWNLLGSNNGTDWTTLDHRQSDCFQERLFAKAYRVDNKNAYKIYRLDILSNKSPSSANSIQLAEIELLETASGGIEPGVDGDCPETTGVSNIDELDTAAVFHYSLLSDLIGDSNRIVTARGLSWMRNSEFVLGGGDDVKSRGTSFEKLIGTDPFYKAKFYPSIGDGECNAYGSGQNDWGAGREFFNFIPGFWDRPNVERNDLEGRDADGNTPSYYAWFEKGGIKVHVLQLHWSDSAPFAATTIQFMVDKLTELRASKTNNDIIHVHAHNGAFIKNLGSLAKNGKMTFDDIELLISTADIITDASQHNGRRFWWGEIFFEDACDWYPRIGAAFEDPNAAVWYNSGIIANDGYMEFHVLADPTRIVIQYMNIKQSDRLLVTDSTWNREDRRVLLKLIDGPTRYVDDWSNLAP